MKRLDMGRALMARRSDVLRGLRAFGVPPCDVEDAAQDVLLSAVARWADYRPSEDLGAWLHGITRRVASNWRRTRERRPAEPSDRLDAFPAPSHEARALARLQLGALPEHLRPLLAALADEGYMLAPAARALDVDEDSLRIRLVSIRRGLPVELLVPRPTHRNKRPKNP